MRNKWALTFTTILFLSIVFLLAITHFVSTTILVTAQEVKVQKARITQSDPASGEQMFLDYCAACHGILGNGDGPAAPFLKTPPTNLTLLAKKNGGNFPADHVINVLQFGIPTTAHGSKDMPVWGELFKSLSASHGTERAESALRIHSLSEYIKTLQAH
jgi:mono/diheme cytochrome c family protein